MIYCLKLKKEAPGLERQPYPGPLGERILANISKEAWHLWLKHQTLLINENRLVLTAPDTRSFLAAEMEKFLFTEDAEKPAGYKEPEQ